MDEAGVAGFPRAGAQVVEHGADVVDGAFGDGKGFRLAGGPDVARAFAGGVVDAGLFLDDALGFEAEFAVLDGAPRGLRAEDAPEVTGEGIEVVDHAARGELELELPVIAFVVRGEGPLRSVEQAHGDEVVERFAVFPRQVGVVDGR